MNQKAIVKCCKELGCCDACCIRFIGLKSPPAYENALFYVRKLYDETIGTPLGVEENSQDECKAVNNSNKQINEPCESEPAEGTVDSDEPPAKRVRTDVCITCLGILQEQNWPQCYNLVKEMLDQKRYECDTFACALSAPIATILRERLVSRHIKELHPDYDESSLTPLKEAWKWSFGRALAAHVAKRLESGAAAPLLVTLRLAYGGERAELAALGAPASRAAAERAALPPGARAPAAAAPAAPAAALAEHAPLYLGGRYVKLSRELPQTPWLVNGRRMMRSSVQEIICEPIAAFYELTPEEAERRLKFMSAGREDVDVRCLGDGRPFAIEVGDPRRAPSEAELSELCARISASGAVRVARLVPVSREDLALLKKGEETKCKTYEALCIKLSHSADDQGGGAVAVTARDIDNINSYCRAGVLLRQRTPVRVLHRRALRVRARRVLELRAHAVPAQPRLFVLRLRTEAGTYVKEWAHGELGRTRPSLAAALRARADILALDVAAVHLPWPPAPPL